MQNEILDEILKTKDDKKTSFMIPERDTSGQKFKSKLKVKAQSKVNCGLRKPVAQGPPAGKENVPQRAKTKVRSLMK